MITHFHIVAGRAEPLKQKDGKGWDLHSYQTNNNPRGRIKWFWKKGENMKIEVHMYSGET